MKPTLGFIGLGLMGTPMAKRLAAAGYSVHIYNRTKEKAAPLMVAGAVWNESPAAVAGQSDIVLTMLTNDGALRDVSTQIQSSLRPGGIHIDCSTVSPVLTSQLEKEYLSGRRGFLHSPVLGSIPQAADGSLLFFVGGKEEFFLTAEPVLNILGSKIWRFAAAETATHAKITMNSFISGMTATLSQALVFAEKSGVGASTILEILSHSALNSASFQAKGASILERNFNPRFIAENLLKDTNLFLQSAAQLGTPAPIAATAKEILEKTIGLGFGKEDYSALIKTMEKEADIEVKKK